MIKAFKFFGSIIAMVVLFFVVGIGSDACHTAFKKSNPPVVAEANIVSLKVGDSIPNGSFFLGSGLVRGETYFITYIKVDTGYRYMKFNTDKVMIFQDEEDRPYVEYKMSRVRAAAGENLYDSQTVQYYAYDIEFHVPEGTIIKEFRLE